MANLQTSLQTTAIVVPFFRVTVFFYNFGSPKLLCLGNEKKSYFPFAFHSTFRNFAQIK